MNALANGLVIITLVIGFFWGAGWFFGKFTRKDEVSPEKPETYGWSESPTRALLRRLPDAPDSHTWELAVDSNDSGHYIMTLGLFSITEGAARVTKSVNLTYSNEYRKTWGRLKQEYNSIHQNDLHEEILPPLVEWAKVQVVKHRSPGPLEYHLGA